MLTLDNGKKDNNNKEEEGDVEEYALKLIIITIWGFNLISCEVDKTETFRKVITNIT